MCGRVRMLKWNVMSVHGDAGRPAAAGDGYRRWSRDQDELAIAAGLDLQQCARVLGSSVDLEAQRALSDAAECNTIAVASTQRPGRRHVVNLKLHVARLTAVNGFLISWSPHRLGRQPTVLDAFR